VTSANEKGGVCPHVGRLLGTSAAAVPLAALPRYWKQKTVRLLCLPVPLIEERDPPWLAGAVRGAWGHRLKAQEETGTSFRPFPGASAFDVFFGPKPKIDHKHPVPAPYAFRIVREGEGFAVDLALFGVASAWWKDAYAALLEALERGVRTPQRKIVSFRILKQRVTHEHAAGIAEEGGALRLRFVTPLILKSNSAYAGSMRGLLFSLATRLEGLAKWHMLSIDEDWKRLAEETRRPAVDDGGLILHSWERYSMRGGNAPVPMVGFTGTVTLCGFLTPTLRAVLRLGALCHAGSYASFGMGGYEILP
jgi:hypothetical protein